MHVKAGFGMLQRDGSHLACVVNNLICSEDFHAADANFMKAWVCLPALKLFIRSVLLLQCDAVARHSDLDALPPA